MVNASTRTPIFKTTSSEEKIFKLEGKIKIENNLSQEDDINSKLLFALDDPLFRDICEKGNKKDFVVYLLSKNIVEFENNNQSNIQMGWFKTNSNVVLDSNIAGTSNVIAVADVAGAVAAVFALVVMGPLETENTLRNDTFKKCVRIAYKLGNNNFGREICHMFNELEKGNKVYL